MTPRRIRDDEAATSSEIRQAIEDLEPSSLFMLRSFANTRSFGLTEDGEDLLNQAFLLTLAGDRSWRREIPFWLHLRGVIKSLSNHAREKLHDTVEIEIVPGTVPSQTEEQTIARLDSDLLHPEILAARDDSKQRSPGVL